MEKQETAIVSLFPMSVCRLSEHFGPARMCGFLVLLESDVHHTITSWVYGDTELAARSKCQTSENLMEALESCPLFVPCDSPSSQKRVPLAL